MKNEMECMKWEQKLRREERRVVDETAKRTHPKGDGGVRMRRRGAKEAPERRKRRRFRKNRRFGREQELLRLEEKAAIFYGLAMDLLLESRSCVLEV